MGSFTENVVDGFSWSSATVLASKQCAHVTNLTSYWGDLDADSFGLWSTHSGLWWVCSLLFIPYIRLARWSAGALCGHGTWCAWYDSAGAAKLRLDLVKAVAVHTLQDLHARADACHTDLNDWLGARFLQEINRCVLLLVALCVCLSVCLSTVHCIHTNSWSIFLLSLCTVCWCTTINPLTPTVAIWIQL